VKASQEIRVAAAGVRSPQEAMRRVEKLVEATVAASLRRIVSTEVMGAFNLADQAGHAGLAVAVPGIRKWWDARGGVRPDHGNAEARTRPGGRMGPIPVLADFAVGRERAVGPHDPRLSAGQRVLCRCVAGYHLPEWSARP
jgi:hypothetical protein